MFEITTKFEFEKVRRYCIKNNLYTRGTCKEYDAMLENVHRHENNPDALCVEMIAEDIFNHSDFDTRYDCTASEAIDNILFDLPNECMTRFVERN